LYWREQDLPAIESAMLRYQGRCAFEAERRAAGHSFNGVSA
jgi:hypothetical protein